jgi:type VI secretion system protein ImpE
VISFPELNEGRLDETLAKLQDQVRNDPSDKKLRIFLFQLLSIMGQWDRAMTQLKVAGEMDEHAMMMSKIYAPALNGEVFRAEVFAGKRQPLLFGEPVPWLGEMVQALNLAAAGSYEAAAELRDHAF